MSCARCKKKRIRAPKIKVNRGIKNPRKIETPRDRKSKLKSQ